VSRRSHGEGERRATTLGAVEMPTDGRRPDGVKNAKVALRWRAFLERTSGREASGEDKWKRDFWRGRVDKRLRCWAVGLGVSIFVFLFVQSRSILAVASDALSVAFPLSIRENKVHRVHPCRLLSNICLNGQLQG
jgi:hypothetical protein